MFEWDVQWLVCAIGLNTKFYGSVVKPSKTFENPYAVSHLKTKQILYLRAFFTDDSKDLRYFCHQRTVT